MKHLKLFFAILTVGLMFSACQKDNLDVPEETADTQDELVVPEIPHEIAVFMSQEDIDRFKAGPGKDYITEVETRCFRPKGKIGKRIHWQPVLMRLEYDLQFVPIGGESCDPGQFQPCLGPGAPADPTMCLSSLVGATGVTTADGYWFYRPVYSEYYPVFCGPDYSGYGSGYYEVNGHQLWLDAENTPFVYDDKGNSTFTRMGTYNGAQSTGHFKVAIGWEKAIMYTAAENNPSNDPNGLGYSDAIIFGWVAW